MDFPFFQILPRIAGYVLIFALMDRWIWHGERDAKPEKILGLGLGRWILGALLGTILFTEYFTEGAGRGEAEVRMAQAIGLVVIRLVLWGVFLTLVGARSFRLAVGTAAGMAMNLALDYLQPLDSFEGFPLHC